MRVFSRYFGIYEDITKNTTRVAMERLQYDLIPEGKVATFNQALMELGALVCTPKTPACDTCPLQKSCVAFARKCVHELPLKSKAKRPVVEKRWVALLVRAADGCILFRQRPPEGLLASMWELPHQLSNDKPQSEGEVQIFEHPYGASRLTLHPRWREQLGFSHKTTEVHDAGYDLYGSSLTVEHHFSHIHWHMTVFAYVLSGASVSPLLPTYRWIHPKETLLFPLPAVFQRIIAHDVHRPYTNGGL
jgi:A/G-specific adenine glycosylase